MVAVAVAKLEAASRFSWLSWSATANPAGFGPPADTEADTRLPAARGVVGLPPCAGGCTVSSRSVWSPLASPAPAGRGGGFSTLLRPAMRGKVRFFNEES